MQTNLAKIRKEKKISRTRLAELLGISTQHLYRIEKNKAEFSFELALRMFAALDIKDLSEFIPEDLDTEIHKRILIESFRQRTKVQTAPLIEWADIADFAALDQTSLRKIPTLKQISDSSAFALTVLDDKLYPRVSAGDIIIIDGSLAMKSGDFCLVRLDNEGYKILTLIQEKAGNYDFVSSQGVKYTITKDDTKPLIGKLVDAILNL